MLSSTTSEPLCVNNDYIDVWLQRNNLYVLIKTILTRDLDNKQNNREDEHKRSIKDEYYLGVIPPKNNHTI